MPLKARISPSAFSSQRNYSMEKEISDLVKEQPGDEPDDVLFDKTYGVRTIELNRPKKLNSLNGSMARKIIPRLKEWEKSQLANVIIMKGVGRAFCAGGDVAALANWNRQGKEGQQNSIDYFALEYKLDHLIATYTKPYVAFMDGITMGGGVGLSVHAPFRIATENTVFAMPETTIGFFPDVGASFFLPKMDGALGTYLALTSEQLKGVDVFYQGIATHYIHSSTLPDLESRLAELTFKDYMTDTERYKLINATIEEFVSGLPSPRPHISGSLRRAVDHCFAPSDISEILSSLAHVKEHEPELAGWASKTTETINTRSPTSVLVSLRQMQLGQRWDIAQTFQKELNIAAHFMAHHDFVEGVTARLIERKKERPNWQPNSFEDATPESIDAFFQPAGQTLSLLEKGEGASYKDYPHAWIGLPREREIMGFVNEGGKNREEVVAYFLQSKDGKMGVREKVDEVLERLAQVDTDGTLSVP
ncbi:mitochondrial 3-hydroxyisobutyryl-CoA hydrolase [Patellaria atrata CBS 101060]|uniref:3-hydroxyisobutyryl-CoA hydrolase n=1 Tax=Patellaria atrata CBS 101060 TaxID=1346257 RepID=A0A9P4S435_9PEZI|nr:mitochondrial 3-hydroxyisobutyryl-CoA hydrolase [Patellaria atrata CBS 101060]